MNENMKKFLEEASKNEELKAKLAALTDKDTAVEKAIEIGKEYGFNLTTEDFETTDGEEVSDDDLKTVGGGVKANGQEFAGLLKIPIIYGGVN